MRVGIALALVVVTLIAAWRATPSGAVRSEEARAVPAEPFGVVLRVRGGKVDHERYDFEFHSDGHGALRLHRKLGMQVAEVTLNDVEIARVRGVLANSPLWSAEGEYGGDAGTRSSARFHVPRRSIELVRPGERRRIEFPRVYAWREFDPAHQALLTDFVELWEAVSAANPDTRLRAFGTDFEPVARWPR